MTGLTCEYCGAERPPEEMRLSASGRRVCRDVRACDARDAQHHREHLAELRRRQREGDELTEFEKQELAR
jgi:hypothetical protein